MINKTIQKSCENLVKICADIKPQETILIISDLTTAAIGTILENIALEITASVKHIVIPPLAMHGQEPPLKVAELMLHSDAIIGITAKSMAHSQARYAAASKGGRYLSLPDYSFAVLERPALQIDFKEMTALTNKIADIFSAGNLIRLRNQAGTNLSLNIRGRRGNAAPGWCFGPGIIASPPDVESNVASIETDTSGVLIVDGSIPCDEVGLLKSPLKLTVEKGLVTDIEGEKAKELIHLFDKDNNWRTRVVGEFGVGLNPKAQLIGNMLEDEGCMGTVHLGIGSNLAFGGINAVSFHLDHIIRKATIDIDDKRIMENGNLLINL